MTASLTRRGALLAGAAAPLAAGLAGPAAAQPEMKGTAFPTFNRMTLGSFEVTTLLVGTRTVEEPQGIFGMDVDAERFREVSAANFLPADRTQFFFTPTLVNTGSELVLFDTGLDPAGITGALAAAGYAPEDVGTVVITHMHGDHIGGLSEGGAATFAQARHVTVAAEFDHWAGAQSDGFEGKVRPLAERFEFVADGGSVASGITAMVAAGHTPGHTTYMLESEGEQLLLIADLANHYVWSLGYPDWEVRFDMDKAAAAASRRRVLGMLAADRVPFVGYHMPFPAVGYVTPGADDGFRYVPMSYQLMMG